MIIKPIISGPIDTNCYLAIDPATEHCVLIDAPPESAEKILPILTQQKLTLSAVLLTHSHWDHSADVAMFKRETGALIYVHPADEYRLIDPNEHSVFRLPFKLEPCRDNELILNDMKISIGRLEFDTLFTPGHTEGGVCFVHKETKTMFCGDTIFCESIGRSDLPGGDGDKLLASIKNKIYKYADDFDLLPGHGLKTTVGHEKKYNPFVRDNEYM
jgi:glyoxylase-like metal-dependent hydrolase (beta-lactamase superfamily II)